MSPLNKAKECCYSIKEHVKPVVLFSLISFFNSQFAHATATNSNSTVSEENGITLVYNPLQPEEAFNDSVNSCKNVENQTKKEEINPVDKIQCKWLPIRLNILMNEQNQRD